MAKTKKKTKKGTKKGKGSGRKAPASAARPAKKKTGSHNGVRTQGNATQHSHDEDTEHGVGKD